MTLRHGPPGWRTLEEQCHGILAGGDGTQKGERSPRHKRETWPSGNQLLLLPPKVTFNTWTDYPLGIYLSSLSILQFRQFEAFILLKTICTPHMSLFDDGKDSPIAFCLRTRLAPTRTHIHCAPGIGHRISTAFLNSTLQFDNHCPDGQSDCEDSLISQTFVAREPESCILLCQVTFPWEPGFWSGGPVEFWPQGGPEPTICSK